MGWRENNTKTKISCKRPTEIDTRGMDRIDRGRRDLNYSKQRGELFAVQGCRFPATDKPNKRSGFYNCRDKFLKTELLMGLWFSMPKFECYFYEEERRKIYGTA